MVPMRGCCLGSTTRVREVPSAPGWPRQSAADAVCAVIASNPRHKAAHCSVRTPTNTLPNMKPPPALPLASDNCTDRYERRLNCLTSSPDLGSRDTIKIDPGGSRDKMDHAIMMVLQIAQEIRDLGREPARIDSTQAHVQNVPFPKTPPVSVQVGRKIKLRLVRAHSAAKVRRSPGGQQMPGTRGQILGAKEKKPSRM